MPFSLLVMFPVRTHSAAHCEATWCSWLRHSYSGDGEGSHLCSGNAGPFWEETLWGKTPYTRENVLQSHEFYTNFSVILHSVLRVSSVMYKTRTENDKAYLTVRLFWPSNQPNIEVQHYITFNIILQSYVPQSLQLRGNLCLLPSCSAVQLAVTHKLE